MNTDNKVNEKLRKELLEEEAKLRKKQPPAWTRQKYRKYAEYLNEKAKREKKATKI